MSAEFPITTSMKSITPDDPLLVGTEYYMVEGYDITPEEYALIVPALKGLKRHWSCLEKAIITHSILNRGVIVLGSLFVTSGDHQSEYGYAFNPPYEFHAWVQLQDTVIDVALPGVIEKGLLERDCIGAFLVERSPVVLAGVPLDWMRYTPRQVYLEG